MFPVLREKACVFEISAFDTWEERKEVRFLLAPPYYFISK
jgi:hypothetical protein